MDQVLLRGYLATVYEMQTAAGPLRVSLDGENTGDFRHLPEPLLKSFAIRTAYNPRCWWWWWFCLFLSVAALVRSSAARARANGPTVSPRG